MSDEPTLLKDSNQCITLSKNKEGTLDISIEPENMILVDISDRRETFLLNEGIVSNPKYNIKGTNIYILRSDLYISIAVEAAKSHNTDHNISVLYINNHITETCIIGKKIKCIFKK